MLTRRASAVIDTTGTTTDAELQDVVCKPLRSQLVGRREARFGEAWSLPKWSVSNGGTPSLRCAALRRGAVPVGLHDIRFSIEMRSLRRLFAWRLLYAIAVLKLH